MDADFFAIDTEFTGLRVYNTINQFSSPSEYYTAINDQTKDFIVIQFGLTAFYAPKTDEEKDVVPIKYKTFNFYLYPRAEKQRFACQGGSMSFLASQDFDFNKLFRDGISFCDLDEAGIMREKHEARQLAWSTEVASSDVAVPVAEEKLLHQIRFSLIRISLCELFLMQNVFLNSEDVTAFLASDKPELVIGRCNAFQRKLAYQLLEQKFAEQVSSSSRTLPNSTTKVIYNFKAAIFYKQLF